MTARLYFRLRFLLYLTFREFAVILISQMILLARELWKEFSKGALRNIYGRVFWLLSAHRSEFFPDKESLVRSFGKSTAMLSDVTENFKLNQ